MKLSISVAGLIEQDNRLLLVQTKGKWGLPSGKADNEFEATSPKGVLIYELAEEVLISPDKVRLWGLMVLASLQTLSHNYLG